MPMAGLLIPNDFAQKKKKKKEIGEFADGLCDFNLWCILLLLFPTE